MLLNQLKYCSIERVSAVLDKIQDGVEGLFQSMRIRSIIYFEDNIAISKALFEHRLCFEPVVASSKLNHGKSRINIKPLAKIAVE